MILNKNKNYFMRHVILLFQKVFVICDIVEICWFGTEINSKIYLYQF